MDQSKLVFRLSRNLFRDDPNAPLPVGGYKTLWSISDQGDQAIEGKIQPSVTIANGTEPGFLKVSYRGQPILDFLPDGDTVKLRLRETNRSNTSLPGEGHSWLTIKNPSKQRVLQLYESGYLYHSGNLQEHAPLSKSGFSIQSVAAPLGVDSDDSPEETKDIVGPGRYFEFVFAPENMKFKDGSEPFKKYENPHFITNKINLGGFLRSNEIFDSAFQKASLDQNLDGSTVHRTLNSGALQKLPMNVPLGTQSSSFPLFGRFTLPEGNGPFPIVLLIHGGSSILGVDSADGFQYLTSMLASWGYASFALSTGFTDTTAAMVARYNKGLGLEVPKLNHILARAVAGLEVLKQFKAWNASSKSFLYRKLDFDKIMVGGNSVGGLATTLMTHLNQFKYYWPFPETGRRLRIDGNGPLQLGPYHFNIRSMFEMAPMSTDLDLSVDQSNPSKLARPILNTDMMLLYGSRDEEVPDFVSYKDYEQVNPVNFKTMVWIYEAAHSRFIKGKNQELNKKANEMEPTLVQTITRLCCLVMANITLKEDNSLKYLFETNPNEFLEKWFLTSVQFITQIKEPGERLFLDLDENSGALGLLPRWNGEVNVSISDNVNYIKPIRFLPTAESKSSYSQFFGNLGTKALEIAWSRNDLDLQLKFDSSLLISNWSYFTFLVAQAPHSLNEEGKDQDILVELIGNFDRTHVLVSQHNRILWPDDKLKTGESNDYSAIVPQTVRIPLHAFKKRGLVSTHIEQIVFRFNQRSSGLIYVSDLGLG